MLRAHPTHTIRAVVELFPQEKGWHHIAIPKQFSSLYSELADRGLISITATLGDSSWKTSLLPKGDGTHFLPLSAKIRKAEKINLGDRISVSFSIR